MSAPIQYSGQNVTIANGAIANFQETTAKVDSEIPTVAQYLDWAAGVVMDGFPS